MRINSVVSRLEAIYVGYEGDFIDDLFKLAEYLFELEYLTVEEMLEWVSDRENHQMSDLQVQVCYSFFSGIDFDYELRTHFVNEVITDDSLITMLEDSIT